MIIRLLKSISTEQEVILNLINSREPKYRAKTFVDALTKIDQRYKRSINDFNLETVEEKHRRIIFIDKLFASYRKEHNESMVELRKEFIKDMATISEMYLETPHTQESKEEYEVFYRKGYDTYINNTSLIQNQYEQKINAHKDEIANYTDALEKAKNIRTVDSIITHNKAYVHIMRNFAGIELDYYNVDKV